MTLQELSKHLNLCRQLEQDEEILAALRAKAYPGAQQLDGMPHGSGVSDKTGYLGAVIADMEADITALHAEIAEERKRLQEYLFTVDDLRIRTIIHLRYIGCLQWKQVADVMGRAYSEDGIKKLLYRFLNE